jgi:hypothetical protein
MNGGVAGGVAWAARGARQGCWQWVAQACFAQRAQSAPLTCGSPWRGCCCRCAARGPPGCCPGPESAGGGVTPVVRLALAPRAFERRPDGGAARALGAVPRRTCGSSRAGWPRRSSFILGLAAARRSTRLSTCTRGGAQGVVGWCLVCPAGRRQPPCGDRSRPPQGPALAPRPRPQPVRWPAHRDVGRRARQHAVAARHLLQDQLHHGGRLARACAARALPVSADGSPG